MNNMPMDRLTQVGVHLDRVEQHLAEITEQELTGPPLSSLYDAVDSLRSAVNTLRAEALERRAELLELHEGIRSARSIACAANARLDDVPGCEP